MGGSAAEGLGMRLAECTHLCIPPGTGGSDQNSNRSSEVGVCQVSSWCVIFSGRHSVDCHVRCVENDEIITKKLFLIP